MDGRTRAFDQPDETIALPLLRYELVTVGAFAVARTVHEPGWRWSDHVRPSAGTQTCETHHIGYCLHGHLSGRLRDGSTFDVRAGNVYEIPPGHDAWVVGDDAVEVIEWVGARSWLHSESAMHGRVLATIVFTDIVKSTGDGFLLIFDGAARALRAAVALRSAATSLGLVTRTAVHTGEIQQADGDVHGIAVHEAARMLDLAGDDEIMVSATTQTLTADAGLTFTERGHHELRDLAGTRAIFVLD